MKQTEYGTQMMAQQGRCPMWRTDGLCRIQAELGEDWLCQVCRAFPRLRHDYGDFLELGLELSCPEAARLILTAPPEPTVTFQTPGGEEPEYDKRTMEVLKASRSWVLTLLDSYPTSMALILLLFYKVFGAFKVGYLRIMDVLLSQVISLICTNAFIYLEINSPPQTTTKNVVLYYLAL